MAVAIPTDSLLNPLLFAGDCTTPHWYALHTRANHEKSLAEQLTERSVEHFLPLYESMRRWKDRRVKLHLPLFPGYILVRIDARDRLRVLQAPGAARLVSSNGSPVPLPDSEIEALRRKLNGEVVVEPHPYLHVGRRVRVRSGTLAGFEGILIRKKHKYRLVLSIDMIMRSVAAEVDIADVEPVY